MRNGIPKTVRICIGLDLGDRVSHVAEVKRGGEILTEDKGRTDVAGITKLFAQFKKGTRVVCEAGTHSPWVSALLKDLGFEVFVANPYNAGRAISATGRKNDRQDSVLLGMLGFDSVLLLRPIEHRGVDAQSDLAIVNARDAHVRTRTALINTARGLVKSSGGRLPSCSSRSFHHKVLGDVPECLRPAVLPLLESVQWHTEKIDEYEKKIEEVSKKYPEVERLQQIGGVGLLTSVAFVLILDDARRFRRSRQVGAFLGLTPAQQESGDCSPQLRITKAGNRYLRERLVNCAHYILGHHGRDCDLRRFGERLAARGWPTGKEASGGRGGEKTCGGHASVMGERKGL